MKMKTPHTFEEEIVIRQLRGDSKVNCFSINRQELLQRVDGNLDLLAKIVKLFTKITPVLLMRIEDGIKRNDRKQIKQAAHNLKGMVSNFSANSVVEAAEAVEMLGETRDFSQANELLDTLKTELITLSHALQNMHVEENEVRIE